MKTINKDVSGREKDYQMDLFSSDGLESKCYISLCDYH